MNKNKTNNLFRCEKKGFMNIHCCSKCYAEMLKKQPKWFTLQGIKTRAMCRQLREVK